MKLKENLITAELPEELIVYDPDSGEAHHLNAAASQVFRLCQQGRPIDESPAAQYALGLLEQKGFFQQGQTRRRALQTLAAAALLPAIASIVVPSPAAAASANVFESDCVNGLVGSCGQICKPDLGQPDFGSIRRCGALAAGGQCACIPIAANPVCACVP